MMNPILSEKEKEVAILVSKGMKDKDIAKTLYISRRRVGEIIATIKDKWNIHHRVEIGIWVYYHGWITINKVNEVHDDSGIYAKAINRIPLFKHTGGLIKKLT
ncbi:Bacterial regulatory proteins, luxR family [Bacillus mobilis]|nr:Bacterial regulatory proteins, luxR family [Bacillus mobilis]